MSTYQCFHVLKTKHLESKTFENRRSNAISPEFVVPAFIQHFVPFFKTLFFTLPNSHILSVGEEKASSSSSTSSSSSSSSSSFILHEEMLIHSCRESALACQALVVGEPGLEARVQQWIWGCPLHQTCLQTCLAFVRTCLYRVFSFVKWNSLDSLIYLYNFYLISPLTCHLFWIFDQYGRWSRGKGGSYESITTFDWQEEFSDASKSITSSCLWKVREIFHY